MREVSDSIHLRRFCRIGISEPVPDESTVRKLTRRLGPEVVHELTRLVIAKARREKRFRPRAARIDSTVVEADVRYPTDAGLASDGVRALAREGRKLARTIKEKRTAVRDRSRAVGRRMRGITRTMRRRSGAPASSRNWPTGARRCQSRSSSASRARRSPTGWCHCGTETRGRSARASLASRTNLGTSINSAR